jgi:hypothetical protein
MDDENRGLDGAGSETKSLTRTGPGPGGTRGGPVALAQSAGREGTGDD